MRYLIVALVLLTASTSFANEKLVRHCSDTALVLSVHALKLSLIVTDVMLESRRSSLKSVRSARTAAKTVNAIGGTVSDELNYLGMAIILRNGGVKSVSDKALITFLVNVVNDLEAYYISARFLTTKIVSHKGKRRAILKEIDNNYAAFQVVANMVMRDIVKIPRKAPKTKKEKI